MVAMKMPIHYGTAHLVKAGMMRGRHFAPPVKNLPHWFGSGQPEQARLSSMIQSPVKPYATTTHWRGYQKDFIAELIC